MPTCTRQAKTTRRLCRREAAEWPHYDDLPTPVVACASHLTPTEWAACQDARARADAEHTAIWAADTATREERDDQARPTADANRNAPRPCTGQCVSQATAWGCDADSALSLCASCDGFVCLTCGAAEVDGELEFCGRCEEPDDFDEELDAGWDDEIDTGPEPRASLTAMVNQIVTATGSTHSYVNARINRTIGVPSRVGVDEHIIRRAARAARDWLDQLLPAPQPAADAESGAPEPDTKTVLAQHVNVEPLAQAESVAPAGERSVPMGIPSQRHANDAEGEHAELTVTVRLTGQSAKRLRSASEIELRPIEEAVAACISDEMRHDVHGVPNSTNDAYAATLDGLARRLARIVRELGALPSGSAAHVIAQATVEIRPSREERMLEQLSTVWAGCTTTFARRSNNSSDRLKES